MAKVFIHDQNNKTVVATESNATLTVNCPSGSTVIATSGQKEHTAISDNTTKAVLTGLHHGTWNVSISNGFQTVTESIKIVTDYEVTIDFFASIINITYPEGSSCTCSDGVITFTAPDRTGAWSCVVPNTGTWTVTCTDGEQSKTKSVVISNDQEFIDVDIAYFMATINVTYPNGAVCSCTNGSTIYSASDTTGTWSFVVHRAGTWTISATDNVQTVESTVNITSDGQVSAVTIRFFTSTINITYPTGAKCTCTDGTTTFTAPNTSGKWTVTVPRTGTWTIKATDGTNEVIKTAEITRDGQSISITCEFFISYINVIYPSGSYKVVLWYIDSYGSKIEAGVDTSSSGSCRFIITQPGNYEVGAYRVIPYVGIETVTGDYDSGTTTISTSGQTISITLKYNTVPEFTYTGNYALINDAGEPITETKDGWVLVFFTSGVFKATSLNGAKNGIDVFVCGGGGNGGTAIGQTISGTLYSAGGGGGGGGYRETVFDVDISENTPYEVKIAAGGGTSSAFGVSASGGNTGGNGQDVSSGTGGGNGGSGGSSGGKGSVNHGGNGTNGEDGMYAFLDSFGPRYGPGGGGGYSYNGGNGEQAPVLLGGNDGGGNSGTDAIANSGGGGGGGSHNSYTTLSPGTGASGIVIIRNKR